MADTSLRGRFLWHELMTTDPRSAEGFYSKVVGWKTQAWEQNPSYKIWMAGGRMMGGLTKHMEEDSKVAPPPSWFTYIGTPDVDETVDQAVALGGKVVKQAWDIPTIGRMAILQDPQAAMFYAFTPERGPVAGETIELGDFSWHELATTDWQSAWNFYQKLFGWEKTSAMDMGGGNMYQMFAYQSSRPQSGAMHATPVGGVFTKQNEMLGPPFWLPYALVRDSKRAAETIKQHGGTIVNGPMEVPGGDWIVAGLDRQGAMFAVHSRKPAGAASPKPAVAKPARPTRPTSPTQTRAAAAKKSKRARKARPVRKSRPARRSKPTRKTKSRKAARSKGRR